MKPTVTATTTTFNTPCYEVRGINAGYPHILRRLKKEGREDIEIVLTSNTLAGKGFWSCRGDHPVAVAAITDYLLNN